MTTSNESTFKLNYEKLLQHLTLKGLRPKTIEAYSRGIRRMGHYFNYDINDLSKQQLLNYFNSLLETHSWSAVKLDLYGLKFFYKYVLCKPWTHVDLIKPPRSKRLPEIVTVDEAAKLFMATRKLSYRVFYFSIYSLGLRLSEGLNLKVRDIDAHRKRVHIRAAKGNKDRFVPLPDTTLTVLRRFWSVHRNPVWLFPNRKGGLKGSATATTPLDRGGVQVTMGKVIEDCGIKKKLPHTVCVTAMRLTCLNLALICLKCKKYSAIPVY